MRGLRNKSTVLVIALMATGAVHAETVPSAEPITFLGVNATLPEASIRDALAAQGYKCSVRDEAIDRLAKMICSKRTGDNLLVTGAGAFATVTYRRQSGEIELNCLAIADGLGETDAGACRDFKGGPHHPRTVVTRLARQGVFRQNHARKRTGENSACFTSAIGDTVCVNENTQYNQTMMVMSRPG